MSKSLATALSIARANKKKTDVATPKLDLEPTESAPTQLSSIDTKALAQAIMKHMAPKPEPEDELDLLDEDFDDDIYGEEPDLAQDVQEKSPLATIMARHRLMGGK